MAIRAYSCVSASMGVLTTILSVPCAEMPIHVNDVYSVLVTSVGGDVVHRVGGDDVLHDVLLSGLLAYNYIMPFTCGFV